MNDTFIEVTSDQFQSLTALPIEGPFQMFNLLKFKEKVEEAGISGAHAYVEYMQAIQPFFQASKARIVYHGKPMFTIIGPGGNPEWDKIMIVEYPSKEAFFKMISEEGYPSHLRTRALEDSRLILCTNT